MVGFCGADLLPRTNDFSLIKKMQLQGGLPERGATKRSKGGGVDPLASQGIGNSCRTLATVSVHFFLLVFFVWFLILLYILIFIGMF